MSEFYKDFTFTWVIENYSFFNSENACFISSPIFTAENIDKTDWIIFIVIENDCSENYVSFQLYKRSKNKLALDFEIKLCNSENEVLHITKKIKIKRLCVKDEYIFENELLLEELKKKMRKTSSDTLILKCRMFAVVESEIIETSLSRSCAVKARQCLDELSYIWEVEYSKSPDWSRMLTFPINDEQQLDLNIKAQQSEILFELRNGAKWTFRNFKCQITLLDHKEKEKISFSDFFSFSKNSKDWHLPFSLKRSMLEENNSVLLLKFVFTFLAENKFIEHVDTKKNRNLLSSPEKSKNISATGSLTNDLRKMWLSKEHADVSFSINGVVISAHKFILATRSPVFSAMFKQKKMLENETGVIDISDMDVQTLQLFLEYIYTGELEDLDWERSLELLLAAEKYQVPLLKEKCSQFLKHDLSTDNVCDVVSVADMVGEHTLKLAAMDYIKENVVKVFKSSKWSMFIKKNFDLCSEIFCNLSEDLKSKHVET